MNDSARSLSDELCQLIGLAHVPIGISFSQQQPSGVARYEGEMPAPTPDGRTGKVPAGCVFWTKATQGSFTTRAEDHGNCSVGSLTHGFKTLEEAATGADVAALVECKWVSPEVFPEIPVVTERPEFVTYGPLHEANELPDVVLLRLNGKQAMILMDGVPGLLLEGKPQCHVVAIAKESKKSALSVGCMLSRVRTGMSANEMTCAIPGDQLAAVVESLRAAAAADKAVAAYAAEDSKRFGDYLN